MIKQGIKNFLVNLKYVFTPLGTLALGLVFGLSVLVPGVIASLSQASTDVQAVFADTHIDFEALADSLINSVYALDWSSPFSALKTMLGQEWLITTLNDALTALVGDIDAYAAQIAEITARFCAETISYIVVLIFFIALGFICGYYLTRWLIRREVAKRTIGQFLLSTFIDSLLTTGIVTVWAWLFAIWKPSAFIITLLALLLFGFVALLEAYIVHGRNKVKISEVIHIKNIAKLYLTDLTIVIIAAVFVLTAVLLTNTVVGLFIGLAFAEIAFIVISLNANAYVKSVSTRCAAADNSTQA